MNRRNFCTGALSTAFLHTLIADAIIGIASAEAATGGITKNYICFWMGGGAERSWFDGVLTPNGSSDALGLGAGVFSAPSASGGPAKWIHQTTASKVNGKYYLPYLWESMLPSLDGGSLAMKNLATNMAIIRGVQTGLTFDAHAQNAQIVQVPFPNQSLIGEIADHSTDIMIPGILSTGAFTSNKNKTASRIGPLNNAYDIFTPLRFESWRNSPYQNAPSKVIGLRKLDNIVTSFITSLSDQIPARKQKSFEVMMDGRKKTVDLIEKGFGALQADYNAAVTRYSQIVSLVMNPSGDRNLRNFDDKNFSGSGIAFQMSETLQPNYGSFNVINGFKNVACENMVHSFAKAEVYLKYKITNNMQLEISEMSNLYDQFSNQASAMRIGFDMHYTGQVIRGVAFYRYYQSFAACMNLFKNQIGSAEWQGTLVHLRSEFNRGDAQERGSDHNTNGCVETFFSGAIQDGPIVAGNIAYSDTQLCNGTAASVPEISNEKIESKHIYSTVGTLMGYTPSRNHPSILSSSGGRIVSQLPQPKNIKVAG